MMSVVALKAMAGAGLAVAGATTAVVAGPPGIATALAHVPTWTHAHAVLTYLQNAFSSGHHPGSRTSHP